VPVNLHAQVEHDALAGQLEQPGLAVLERKGAKERRQVDPRDAQHAGDVAGGDVAIDHDQGEVRRRELERRMREDGRCRERDLPAVRPQVREQAPHQPRVVGLAEDLLFVAGHHDAASSSSNCCWRASSA
jgi:hypothetical protein